MGRQKILPHVNQILAGLKDFQQNTVEYAFSRLYKDEKGTKRFLVADEVGLGKTLVAKGIIAKAIDKYSEQIAKGEKRFDIIYLCSNAEIARQNINRLNITGQDDIALATRITLLPINLKNLKDNPINFISFTPGTSFNLRSNSGIKGERALVFHILNDYWGLGWKAKYRKFMQCDASDEGWDWEIRTFKNRHQIDDTLRDIFLNNLKKKIMSTQPGLDIRSRFEEVAEGFQYLRKGKRPEYNIRVKRNQIVGELRSILAISCIDSLEPDLIILDEFQRFKNLLDGQDEMSLLAKELFDYPDARVLLLSATPYKMYTMYHEEDDNHYEDFLRTVNFLLNSEHISKQLKEELIWSVRLNG